MIIKKKRLSKNDKIIEPKTISLECPAEAKYIAIIRLVTSLLAKRSGFSKENVEDLIMTIGESCVNVIRHAYKNNYLNLKIMSIRFLIYPKKMVLIVKDYGRGFDPQFVQRYIKRADVNVPEKVGLGIFLIKTLMDEVEYDSSVDKGTHVRMTKHK